MGLHEEPEEGFLITFTLFTIKYRIEVIYRYY